LTDAITLQAHEAKIAELKAALEAAAAAAVVAQQDATFAFNATQAQLRAKHDEAATAMQRADYTESELRRVTAEVTFLYTDSFLHVNGGSDYSMQLPCVTGHSDDCCS
jgi:hypothetical protein